MNLNTHLDLCSGIGGFALAAKWAGLKTLQFCEKEGYCRAVLAKNFPGIPIDEDLVSFDARPLRRRVSLLTAGFPCQDISAAGKGAGLSGERSSLWFEVLRVIGECQPEVCLIENVPALRTRGIDTVLEGLEAAGYAAEPYVVGADDVGASHKRKRVWIVAYCAGSEQQGDSPGVCGANSRREVDRYSQQSASTEFIGSGHKTMADAQGVGHREYTHAERQQPAEGRGDFGSRSSAVADATSSSQREQRDEDMPFRSSRRARLDDGRSGELIPVFPPARNDYRGWAAAASVDASKMPCVEREIRRGSHGLPRRLDGLAGSIRNHQLKALGNAIVPHVAYCMIRAIQQEAS